MRHLAALALLILIYPVGFAWADDIAWPALQSGEIKVFHSWQLASAKLRIAAEFPTVGNPDMEFTYFKAPKGRDYVVVTPCCGESANHAALFEYVDGNVRQVGLPVGDPRLGFTTQVLPNEITVDADAKSIRAHVKTPSCEDGEWRYFYTFDAADRLTLRSVIDTSCEHLGIRELYHSPQVDVGKWWNK